MDHHQLEQLGEELRGIGHKRRKLVEQIYHEVNEGDHQSSIDLYKDLSDISDQAIQIMERQKQMFDNELKRM